MTEARSAQLDLLSQQEPSLVEKWNDGVLYLIRKGRDFITADDFVSDRYFAGYFTNLHTNEVSHDYIIIAPSIGVWVYSPETKDKILKDYKGKLTLSNREQGKKSGTDSYKYYFDCHFNNSEQVLNLANKIFLRNDVKWAEASMLAPIHLQ